MHVTRTYLWAAIATVMTLLVVVAGTAYEIGTHGAHAPRLKTASLSKPRANALASATTTTTELPATTTSEPTTTQLPLQGSLAVLKGLGPGWVPYTNANPDYGWGGSGPGCATWRLDVKNNSNINIDAVTITGTATFQRVGTGLTLETSPADLLPTTDKTSLAPGATENMTFDVCSSLPTQGEYTPAPTGVEWTWANGQTGLAH